MKINVSKDWYKTGEDEGCITAMSPEIYEEMLKTQEALRLSCLADNNSIKEVINNLIGKEIEDTKKIIKTNEQ